MIRVLASLLLWLAASCNAIAAGPDLPESADPDQQILVLLQMPPDHYRPGTNYAGGYSDRVGRSGRRSVAARLAKEHGLILANDWPVAELGVDCYVMNVPAEHAGQREALVQALGRDPRVAWAQTMNVYRVQAHNDPLYSVQPVATAWHLAELHELATGRQMRVAVIDSAVELAHPDLDGQIELSENFVPERPLVAERHGTEVAGIIAARANNQIGIVGVAPDARLLALRACWQQSANATLCTSLSLARALDFAIAHNVQVINLSLGGPTDRLLAGLLDSAKQRGIAVVAAVDRTLPDGGFPASYPGVIAVADDGLGPVAAGVLLAPGHDVPTTGPTARWYLVSGSSYAAAHVSGLLALLHEVNGPGAAPPTGAAISRAPTGAIDACGTVTHGRDLCACSCAVTGAVAPLSAR
jgi:subtilisin family serine protease